MNLEPKLDKLALELHKSGELPMLTSKQAKPATSTPLSNDQLYQLFDVYMSAYQHLLKTNFLNPLSAFPLPLPKGMEKQSPASKARWQHAHCLNGLGVMFLGLFGGQRSCQDYHLADIRSVQYVVDCEGNNLGVIYCQGLGDMDRKTTKMKKGKLVERDPIYIRHPLAVSIFR